MQIRRADYAVVVLAGNRAMIFRDQRIDLLPHFFDDLNVFPILHIHERDDVKVAIAGMAGDSVIEIVGIKDSAHFRQKCRHVFRPYHHVVDERRRTEAMHVLPQEIEALASDSPIFIGLFF